MGHLNKTGLLILLAGLFIIFSCAKEPTEIERTPTSTFPLTEGSRWEYNGLWHQVPFNDPSLADTATIEVCRHVIGEDSLSQLIVCDDTVITSWPAGGEADTSIHRKWVQLNDVKLKLFGYAQFALGDTAEPIFFIGSPAILYDFPLFAEKGWIVYSQILSRETKAVAGIDYIELPYGWEYCDVVRGAVTEDATGDTLRGSYEWLSNNGLMRVEYDHGVCEITDEFGTILDSARTYETWELIDIDIRP